MEKEKVFKRELSLLSENYRQFAISTLNELVPEYFWTTGASSSGKYHPAFSQGDGGLARHVRAVVMFAEDFVNSKMFGEFTEDEKNQIYCACIFHDCCKYGFTSYEKKAYPDHPKNAEVMIRVAWKRFCPDTPVPEAMCSAVRTHMGQWGKEKPVTRMDKLVHLADYFASRSFIDIPEISDAEEGLF